MAASGDQLLCPLGMGGCVYGSYLEWQIIDTTACPYATLKFYTLYCKRYLT